MPIKRELPDDYYNSEPEDNIKIPPSDHSSPNQTPTKKTKSTSTTTSPKKTKSPKSKPVTGETISSSSGNRSDKSLVAEAIIKAGLASLDKKGLEEVHGISVRRQNDMLRQDGKGALYKALMELVRCL